MADINEIVILELCNWLRFKISKTGSKRSGRKIKINLTFRELYWSNPCEF
jgi:hypothetical protein